MNAVYPNHIRVQLNPIAKWDKPTLQTQMNHCHRTAQFFSAIATVIRVAVIVLGLIMLATLGMLNPFYFPITLSMLMLVYHPFMSITYHQLSEWAKLAREEANKYQGIIEEFEREQPSQCPFVIPDHEVLGANNALFKRVISAQYCALEAQKKPLVHPNLETLRSRYQNIPSEEHLKNITEAERKLCIWKYTNIHLRIHQAFLVHVAQNPLDQSTLKSFGHLQALPINDLKAWRSGPLSTFVLSEGKSISDHMITNASYSELAQLMFNS